VTPDTRETRIGAVYGAGAFLWWGFAPFYFRALDGVAPLEILAHRIVWSAVFLAVLLALRGGLRRVWALAAERRTLATMAVTALLVSVNWLVFIWSISVDRLMEASLGYFINPLVNVLLGFVFLRERLRPLQWVAVALAAAGVVWLTAAAGRPPWIALVLAFSFGIYGLLRKLGAPSGVQGVLLETALLTPLAVAFLLWRQASGLLAFGHGGPGLGWLLAAAGPVTALPLVWFAEGARRLRYATIGFLQYLAPTLQFLVAALVFGEPFAAGRAVGFGVIWVALALYSVDLARSRVDRRAGRA
jgi:chloramphenicol-sensitive protein RarD